MTGLAARPGTAVLPMCSISSTQGPMIRSPSKSVGQRGSYGTTTTGSSTLLATGGIYMPEGAGSRHRRNGSILRRP
jgi:hypothetical protein